MKRLLFVMTFGVLVFAASVAPAHAGTIGPTCGSCQGGVYSLTNLGQVTDINSDGFMDTWRIVLSIDTDLYTGGGVRIDEVAVKVSSSADKANLVDAPGGIAVWQVKPGGLNANGCSGSGSGFECGDWIVGSPTGAFLPTTNLLTWTFDIDISSPLLTGDNQASIKVRYVDANNVKVGDLVSENITLGTRVPEPGTLTLMGLALAGAAVRRRKAKLALVS